ncbi:MAG: BREX-1 system adenine-specific DNA-methyltransferase PglX, partial [Lachnospiraceae bacterium]|nr:BREX-1 system adenine-specific DNA-methyltransferase PglX [Lachnospiraceae bacterium]
WARRELISRVSQKAEFYGVTAKGYGDFNADSIDGRVLSPTEKSQRQALIHKVRSEGCEQIMEEVAYTWFNRFSALRYMEINNYLPTRVRVFTNENGEFKPQIIDEAIHLELDGLDMEKVYSLKDANDTEALYRYLLITQCNALSNIMPVMFQKIDDYTELLLPDYLLREGSVIEQMVTSIPEEDWTDQVQIIGWLYQYYNAEKKDEVFAALKKNVKITKENIPAATQLFTPDWIVRYMVENSLGRLWVEGHPNEQLKSGWKYYLEEAEQEADVEAQLAEIRKEYAALKPEEILCIDPCAGSGHILDYLFDILMQIYTDYGYTTSEAVRSIVENNLYGLDIDERAAQLAYFSVMMKARSYDRRFLTRKDEDGNPDIPQPHMYAIVESNYLNQLDIEYFTNNDPKLKKNFGVLVDELHDAKEYGSILNVSQVDFSTLYARMDEVRSDISMYKESTLKTILPLIQVAEALVQKYHVVVTNPPYMGSSGMGAKLGKYVKDNYSDSKSDLFAVFIERCGVMTAPNGYQAMITQHAWMFLSSFEKLRGKLLQNDAVNMAHLGARAFEEIGGEVVQTTSFVLCNRHIANHKGTYCRLIEPTTQQGKEDMFLSGANRYTAQQSNFTKIPGSPVAYWLSASIYKAFDNSEKFVKDYAFGEGKNVTTNNAKYILHFWEVSGDKINGFGSKWLLCAMGGDYRKWYGNVIDVIDWSEEAREFYRITPAGRIIRREFWNISGITWGKISSSSPSFRILKTDYMYQETAILQHNKSDTILILALLNSNVSQLFLKFLAPTINFQLQDICSIPIAHDVFTRRDEISQIASLCLKLSADDWDSFETSWDFKRHPLVVNAKKSRSRINGGEWNGRIEDAYFWWENECSTCFAQLKANEEKLNRIFIDIYGLQDELTPEVEDKDVTVRLADKACNVKSLLSYAVGCMFGRYSLDMPGLAYTGGEWDASKYSSYIPDKDGILPICDDEYFEDDIANRFVDFVRVVYGKDTLEENLKFIADALGGKGAPRQVIRDYFMNDFYADHLKVYQKRPIYWLFDSGRKNGFKCLIYIHRYKPDTIARIRTDYVHEQQARYRTAIAGLENQIANAGTSERVKLNKQLKKLQDQADELHGYEEKIHHLADQFISIDFDDGVKHNYEIFKDVLAKIK